MERVIAIVITVLFVQNVYTSPLQTKLLSYSIPEKRPFKKALGYYEDSYLNFTELTTKYGYRTETHNVVTDDGYILTMFRLLPKCSPRGFPILMMHGIYDTSDEYILTGPETGLGYVLSNNCFDVWAANHRGNVYSRQHVRLDPNRDPEYWDYTFDEHGYYDIPALVDYVLAITQQPKVNYIGHSQGTTDFYVMASLKPEYNDKIGISFHLAPIAWMKNIVSPIPKLLAPAGTEVKNLLYTLGLRELFAKQQITHFVVELLCQFAPDDICGTGFTATTGYRRGNISSKNLAIAFGHLFAGISTKDIDHFAQLVTSGRFQRYDEGREGNIKRYGSSKPPEYDVSRITSAVVLICGANDWVSSLKDIDKLRSKLPNVVEHYVVPDPSWSHNDHVYGVNAPKYVFSKILEHLNT